MQTKDEFLKEHAQDKRDAFQAWMQQSMVRAMISMLPASEHMEMVLRSAFEAGYGSGSAQTALSFLTEVIMRGGPRNGH